MRETAATEQMDRGSGGMICDQRPRHLESLSSPPSPSFALPSRSPRVSLIVAVLDPRYFPSAPPGRRPAHPPDDVRDPTPRWPVH